MNFQLFTILLTSVIWLAFTSALKENGANRIFHKGRRHHEKRLNEKNITEKCQANETNSQHHGVPGGNIFEQIKRLPDNVETFLQSSSYIALFDADKDGALDREEIQTILQFPWRNEEQAWLANLVLGLNTVESLMSQFDLNKDEKITEEEMQKVIQQSRNEHERTKMIENKPAYRKRTQCQRVYSQRLEKCRTEDVLQCSPYAHFAEMKCTLGKEPSAVERCFEQEPCNNICSCISKLERKAKEDYIARISANTKGSTKEEAVLEKRIIPFFLGGALAALFDVVGTFAVASTVAAILSAEATSINKNKAITPFLDTIIWDGNGSPPSCSTYLYWSKSCGPVLSGAARNCNPIGERVYPNSCKDHFRMGSKSCNFLGFGCKSLCWATELTSCKCDLFNYDVHTDTSYPGFYIYAGKVDKISQCSQLCTDRFDCVAFEIPPLTKEGLNQNNCFLKSGGDDPVQQIGMTTFIKIQRTSKEKTNQCNVGQGDFHQLPYGVDWSNGDGNSFSKRDQLLNQSEEIDQRSLPPNKGSSSKSTSIRYRRLGLGQLLALYYRSRTQPDSIRNSALMNDAGNSALINIPSAPVAPHSDQPIRNTNGGGWTFAEIQFRVLNHHRRMMELGSATQFVDEARQTEEGRRQFPQEVRNIIAHNDNLIYNQVAGPMLHINTPLHTTSGGLQNYVMPLRDTQMPYDRNAEYVPAGAVGPVGLDAAFVLATQLAGVRYDNVHASAQAAQRSNVGAGDYTATIVQGGSSRSTNSDCLTIDTDFTRGGSSTSNSIRNYAVIYQDPTQQYNSFARAGYYFAFDMEPTAGSDSRNLFVFTVHTADPSSYIVQAQGDPLENPNLAPWNIFRTGGNDDGQSRPPNRRNVKQNAANLNPASNPTNTRALSHAHAGIVDRDRWLDWIITGNAPRLSFGPPLYTQLHRMHIFLHPDDTSPDRLRFQNHGGQNPPGLDDDPPARRREKSYLMSDSLFFMRSQMTKIAGNLLPINFGLVDYRF